MKPGQLLKKQGLEVTRLESDSKKGVSVVYFNDSRILDLTQIQQICEELWEQAANAYGAPLLLNLSNVVFMSSTMLAKLKFFAKHCESSQVNLRLCELTEDVFELVEFFKLGELFTIYDNESEALNACNDNLTN